MRIMLDEGAYMPERGCETDAGFDLRTPKEVFIRAHDSCVIDTGVHVEIPKGCYGRLECKYGLNFKSNVVCPGGIIDESSRGSVVVKLYNLSEWVQHLRQGDKIAQLVIVPYIAPEMEVVADFNVAL